MTFQELLKAINPGKAGDGKYSRHLYSYLKRHWRLPELPRVYKSCPSGTYSLLYMGYVHPQFPSDFDGFSLQAVLHGRRPLFGCYTRFFAEPDAPVEITDFWDQYLLLGKCYFDPEHHWATEGRFTLSEDGAERTCNWCGAKHKKVVRQKIVDIDFWETQA